MSAKQLLYNLSDENPKLNKQFGCMNGIFRVFYRHHYQGRSVAVSGYIGKSSPIGGERRDIVGEIHMESDKETETSMEKKKKKKKTKHRVFSESSSRPSFSSSPRSSSFSSTEVSTTASCENLIREQQAIGGMTMPYDIKELVKGSINRDMRIRCEEDATFNQKSGRSSMLLLKEPSLRSNEGGEKTSKFKEIHRLSYDEREARNKKETHRLSLDSRTTSLTGHRRSNSSVVAKLMGLEIIDENVDAEQRKENRFCDSPRPMSRAEPTALLRSSRSVDSTRKIPASKFPMEPAPWKQINAGDATVTVYGEIQKRLTQLEFKKSGKDLRALKQILEAMEKTRNIKDGSIDNRTLVERTHPSINFKSSSIVALKLASPNSTSQNASLPDVKVRKITSGKQSAMDLTPRPKTLRSRQALAADSCSMTRSSRSPRIQPKKLEFGRQSRPTTPKSEPGKIRQETESASPSPRGKQFTKPRSTLQQPDDRVRETNRNLRSLKSDRNIITGSNVDIEVTSRHRVERNCDSPKQRSPELGIRPSLKPLKVTVEKPSPISVLDAAFDEEDSPSPVRKISLSLKGDDGEESVWINKPTGVYRSEKNSGPRQLEYDLLECFPEEEGADDHKYISEILLASGLLRDIEYSMISIQLRQKYLPINPGLFFILEQNNTTQLDNKHRGPREKIRRKLVFDTVNEILAKKFSAEGCCGKPQIKKMEKRSKGEQLVETVYSEIDRLQKNNSRCMLEGEDSMMKLKEFCEGESGGIVLDIERMIFRDLVNEVCFS